MQNWEYTSSAQMATYPISSATHVYKNSKIKYIF